MQEIFVDQEKCIGCGACAMYAPDAFEMDSETGKSKVKEGAGSTDRAKVDEAKNACPTQAIIA
jgi:ferredoxin